MIGNNKIHLNEHLKLMRLDKPIGILLLLWPTLIGLWFAGAGKPAPTIVIIFVVGVVIMRSAGCILNDLADRDFDKHVQRTKLRPLARQTLSITQALGTLAVLLVIAALLAWQLNPASRWLAVGGLALASIYPFMKRYTNYPQLILSIAFAWPVPMAFTALNQPLSSACLLLFAAIACWIMAFDTEYAMADKTDDLKIGVKSTAITFGNYDKFFVGLCHAGCLVLLLILGLSHNFANTFYLALASAGVLAIYQQQLIKYGEPSKCLQAFRNNNYFGIVLFLGFYLSLKPT